MPIATTAALIYISMGLRVTEQYPTMGDCKAAMDKLVFVEKVRAKCIGPDGKVFSYQDSQPNDPDPMSIMPPAAAPDILPWKPHACSNYYDWQERVRKGKATDSMLCPEREDNTPDMQRDV